MRRRAVARPFYPGDCAKQVDKFLAGFEPPSEPAQVLAGIVPHAGWVYSGTVAAKVFRCFRAMAPETFVLFGAVHSWGARPGAVFAEGSWETPLGDVEVDAELAGLLLERCAEHLSANAGSHDDEHSIEVQVPMIRHLYPKARIVPIAMPPGAGAVAAGTAVGAVLAGLDKPVAVVGSSDLTHYGENYGQVQWGFGAGARERMMTNDRRLIDLVLRFEAEEVEGEARSHANACGAGAVAAVVAVARAMGADRSALVEYTTSHDVTGERPDSFRMAVGYAGIVLGTQLEV